MTAAKHTPGPWQISPGSSLNAFTIHADEAGVLIGYTFPRVKVSKGQPESQEPTDEDWANAYLIAAAPELLATLERLASAITQQKGITAAQIRPGSPLGDAQMVIRKARGVAA